MMKDIVVIGTMPEVYIKFVEMGGPILYEEGVSFSLAVKMWGLRVLKAVRKKRLNLYMKYRVTAHNLLKLITNIFIENAGIVNKKERKNALNKNYKLLNYLLDQDTREQKSMSTAYNHLKKNLKSYKDVSKVLEEMIPSK